MYWQKNKQKKQRENPAKLLHFLTNTDKERASPNKELLVKEHRLYAEDAIHLLLIICSAADAICKNDAKIASQFALA